jgi:hypothetical protein
MLQFFRNSLTFASSLVSKYDASADSAYGCREASRSPVSGSSDSRELPPGATFFFFVVREGSSYDGNLARKLQTGNKRVQILWAISYELIAAMPRGYCESSHNGNQCCQLQAQ